MRVFGRIAASRGMVLIASNLSTHHTTIDLDMADSGRSTTSVSKRRHAKCNRNFYDVPCIDLARRLLGQLLVCDTVDGRVSGRIVETEAYPGGEDKASHSFNGRRTPGNVAMFMEPGTAYVYLTYGMHHCMNISSQGDGAAVLLRALEPLDGLELMRSRRGLRFKGKGSKLVKDKDLCNGPAKLCQSFAVTKDSADRKDLTSRDSCLWIERVNDDFVSATDVVSAPRVGIGSVVEEWASKPFRFYVRHSSCVSVRYKKAELESTTT